MVSSNLSWVVTLPLMMPEDRKRPSTRRARTIWSKVFANSSGRKVTRLAWLRPARKGQ